MNQAVLHQETSTLHPVIADTWTMFSLNLFHFHCNYIKKVCCIQYLTIIRQRRSEYWWIFPETKSRGIFTNIHEPEANSCFSIITQVIIEIPKKTNQGSRLRKEDRKPPWMPSLQTRLQACLTFYQRASLWILWWTVSEHSAIDSNVLTCCFFSSCSIY